MEGIYVYRANRIILFGGWNGLIRKGPRLQLARLRVEVGNQVDHLLHLNVSKSQIEIPHDLRPAFETYIEELKAEAEREYFNRGPKRFKGKGGSEKLELFSHVPSSKGLQLELNHDFPLIKKLESELSQPHKVQLRLLVRMINTSVSKMRRTHEDKAYIELESENSVSNEEMLDVFRQLLEGGMTKETIKNTLLSELGYKIESLPDEVIELLR